MDSSNGTDINAVVSSGNTMYFNFTTDLDTEFSGFQVLYFHNDTGTQYPCDVQLTATSTKQVLMSPNLPHPYYEGDTCQWYFTGSDLMLFQIVFMDMECGGTTALRIFDGNRTTILDSVCETSLVYTFTDVLTSLTTAYIEWQVSNTTADFFGFMLTYRLDGPENIYTTCVDTGYNISAIIDPKYDYIESPFYGSTNYHSNAHCIWYITAPGNYSVEVRFDQESYGIEYNYYCSWDFLLIYDGHNTTTDPLLNRLCGHDVPQYRYRSTDRYMLLIFQSDYAIEYSGFRLLVTAKDNLYPGCVDSYTQYLVTYNTKYDYIFNNYTYINHITSPNYGGYNRYPNNVEMFWLFTNDNTTYYRMVLDIQYISVESAQDCLYDKLILYDGPCIASGILDKLCGWWAKRWDLSGPEHLLHFHTDNSFTYYGFNISYYAEANILTPPPTTPRTTTNGPPVEAVVNAIKDALVNYTSENVPTKNISLAITASLDFYLVGVNGIDEVEQKMTSTGQFVVKWIDESLAWDPTKRQGIVRLLLPQNDLWKPDVALMNGFSTITAMGSSFMFIDVDYEGNCTWRPYQIMESVCKVDLTHYPYDRQTCVLKFGTWGSDDSEVVTELGALGLQIHPNFQENAEWKLISHRTEQVDNNHHKIVEFFLELERNPQYVSYYMTVPIIMLAYLNVFTFVVPTESGEKTGFSITIFLSFVVLLIITNSSMPENSDTISLYAAYLLTLTIFSAVGLVICVVQVKLLTLIEWRYQRYSCIVKTVKAVKKLRDYLACRKCRKSPDDEDKKGDDSNVDDSDKEELLGDFESERSFDANSYVYKPSLKKKQSVTFVDDKVSSESERTIESPISDEETSDQSLPKETTLFIEHASVREPTKIADLSSERGDSGEDSNESSFKKLNLAVPGLQPFTDEKELSDDDNDDDDQVPNPFAKHAKLTEGESLCLRTSSAKQSRVISPIDEENSVPVIQQPVKVNSLTDENDDDTENADIRALSKASIHSENDREQVPELPDVNNTQDQGTGRSDDINTQTGHPLSIDTERANDATSDEKQTESNTHNTEGSTLKTSPDLHVNESSIHSGNHDHGSLLDNIADNQATVAVEYRMMRPLSAHSRLSINREVTQSPAYSRPVSTFKEITSETTNGQGIDNYAYNNNGFIQDEKEPASRSTSRKASGLSSGQGPVPQSPDRSRLVNRLIEASSHVQNGNGEDLDHDVNDKVSLIRPTSREGNGSILDQVPDFQTPITSRPSSNKLKAVSPDIQNGQEPDYNVDDAEASTSNKKSISRPVTREASNVSQTPAVDPRPTSRLINVSSVEPDENQHENNGSSSEERFSNKTHDSRPFSRKSSGLSFNQVPSSRSVSECMKASPKTPQRNRSVIDYNNVEPSTSDKDPFSRPLSRKASGLTFSQLPVSRMSQRIGIGLMGQEMESQRVGNDIDPMDKNDNGDDAFSDNDCTSVKSIQSAESVSTVQSDNDNDDDDNVSWSDVVSCLDFLCFVFFLFITTVLTLGLFMNMILAF
ncbi:hypothetical protein ACF0H5_010437 [Mactra antiquata]